MKRKRSRLIDLGQVLEYAFELLTFHEVIQCRLVNQRCNENWEQYMKVQLHRIDLSKFHDKRISQLLVQHSSPLYHGKFGNRLPNLEVFRQLMTPNLVSLDFINSRCVLDVYIRIIAATCHQLKSFRLGSNSNNDGVRELIKMNHQTLQILDFADSSMIDNIEMCSQLHSLSFRAPIQGRFENAVINFRAFDLITELDLAGQDWRYGKELKSCAHLRLQRLNISRLAVAEEDMDTLIIEMHRTGNNWRNMVDLDMSNIRNISTTEYFGLSDTTLLRFLSLFTCLKRLDVSNHEQFSDPVLDAIVLHCAETLLECYFIRSKVTKKSITYVTTPYKRSAFDSGRSLCEAGSSLELLAVNRCRALTSHFLSKIRKTYNHLRILDLHLPHTSTISWTREYIWGS